MNDDILNRFNKPPRPEFVSTLYKRINVPAKENAPRRFTRFSIGVTLVLSLILIFSPAIRTFAWQGILQIGRILFSGEPTYAEQFEMMINGDFPTPTPDANATPIEWQKAPILTLAETSRQAGFEANQVYGLLEDYEMVARFVTSPDSENCFTRVTTTFQSREHILVFSQTLYECDASPWVLPVGDAAITDVTVQDTTGVWIRALRLSTYVDDENRVAPQFASVLVWEKDGFEFWLQATPSLPFERMLEIAESIY